MWHTCGTHVAHLNEMTVVINRYCRLRYVFGKPPKNQQMEESEGMTGWIDDLSGTTEPGQGTCWAPSTDLYRVPSVWCFNMLWILLPSHDVNVFDSREANRQYLRYCIVFFLPTWCLRALGGVFCTSTYVCVFGNDVFFTFFASQVCVFFALIEPVKSMLCSTHVPYGTVQKRFTCPDAFSGCLLQQLLRTFQSCVELSFWERERRNQTTLHNCSPLASSCTLCHVFVLVPWPLYVFLRCSYLFVTMFPTLLILLFLPNTFCSDIVVLPPIGRCRKATPDSVLYTF